jgi:protoheme IX farnesyltransferase
MIKTYYWLTKPGIIYGNAITASAGFFLASKGIIDWWLFLAMLVGLSFIIGSGCVFNNILDKDVDSRMDRTKNRATVTGVIPKNRAIIFGVILLLLGSIVLRYHVNSLSLLVTLVGFFVYVALYTPLKRKTIHATLIGAIAGAVPPVVGYTAVSNHLDLGALLLFLILVAWQMPHFYAIAIYRLDDYTRAMIPVLPVKKGVFITKVNIMIYIIIYIIITSLLTINNYTGYVYLVISTLFGITWFFYAAKGFRAGVDNKLWAKKVFKFSLIVLTALSLTISIGAII